MVRRLDVLIVNPDSSAKAYQDLAVVYAAIEPPTWALLLAQAMRAKGHGVAILDCDAEKLTLEQSVVRIRDADPRVLLFCVYGQNPNSGTTSMIGASLLAEAAKRDAPGRMVAFVGSHTSAQPREVLAQPFVDVVFLNEGVYALDNLLRSDLADDLRKVRGIGWKRHDGGDRPVMVVNPPERVVPTELMDQDMPGYAWDLLPFREKPLDMYRAHFWHAGFDHAKRTPFAAIYTSLGCQFACNFCMINIVNRNSAEDEVDASHSKGMRFWSPDFMLGEIEKLAAMGVETLRLSDEMFFLNRRYYEPLLDGIVDRGLQLNMWAYSRIDTVRKDKLELFRKAGVNWLALGVEAGNQIVRQEVAKGSFKDVNIREICSTIRSSDINIISNYIFGFPEDTPETMRQTLDLALELNTEMANMYPCQALPGSPLYTEAKREGWKLPSNYEGYAFLAYETEPLPTKHCSAAEVLKFRDEAWQTYFTNPTYLDLVENRFGSEQRANVEDMAKIRLKRKLLGD
jgi:anaerobic magnesium-protoporphyrin IX monomethyl ester cyclase